jgi:elongation factor G
MSVEPKTKVDQEKMGIALQRLAEEDPTFRVYTDEETGQTIIAGMGELHLEIIRDRMLREFKVEANSASRRSPTARLAQNPAHGVGQADQASPVVAVNTATWKWTFAQAERGRATPSKAKVVGGHHSEGLHPCGKERASTSVAQRRARWLPGYRPRSDIVFGSYHDVDSNELGIKMAAIFAMKDAFKNGTPILLEPIMKVEKTARPEDYQGDIMGDLIVAAVSS